MDKIKVMTIFGVRPEAIKMAPLLLELSKYPEYIDSVLCVTGQHREMLDQVLEDFQLTPSYDLNIMQKNQTLQDITIRILEGLETVLQDAKPDLVLVHGDTLTTFLASYAAFLQRIEIGHVEAGLRTWNKDAPFPEEMNRQLTGVLADLHFAPTHWSAMNLQKENKPLDRIHVTGNTITDVFKYTIQKNYSHPILDWVGDRRLILMTAHRRESHGEPHRNIFRAVRRIVDEVEDVVVVYPVHPSPIVQATAHEILGNHDRISLIDPLDVIDLHNFYPRTYLILTDSGGIQEEAPSFGVPVLVLRETTERPEGIEAGILELVGTEEEHIYERAVHLLKNELSYHKMSKVANPYGDGKASERIAEAILYHYGLQVNRPDSFNHKGLQTSYVNLKF